MAKNSGQLLKRSGAKFRKPAVRFDLSGIPQVAAVLKELGKNHGDSVERRLSRAALGAGLRESAKVMKEAAPKGSRIKKSVGTRFAKNRRTGIHEAKAGLNVGKKNGTAPHAHFFVLGTAPRETEDGRNRGFVEANRFVRKAINQDGPRILVAMLKRIDERLPFEIARARKAAGNG